MKSEVHYWKDETGGKSRIEGLVFAADKNWKNGKITVTGKLNYQKVDLEIYIENELVLEKTCKLDKNETEIIEFQVNGRKSVNITGTLKNSGVLGAGANIIAEIWYEGEAYQSKSVRWSDETAGLSVIENLCLEGTKEWTKCDIRLQGKKDRATQCYVTLIAGGALKEPLYERKILNGTEEIVLTYEINNKVPLVVAGYISNMDIIGAGAEIILTGYYEEGYNG